MRHRLPIFFAGLLLLCSTARGQIKVNGAGSGFNALGTGTPSSGDMGNPGDLFVRFDLEVGDRLYLNRSIYMEASASSVSDSDQTIFFYNGDSREGEFLRWDESQDAFALSDDLELQRPDPLILGTGDLELESTGFFQSYTAFDTGAGGPFYNWRGKNSGGDIDTLMNLTGPDGRLRLKGTVAVNDIDLAENFWLSHEVRPGEVVVADPERPGAVRLSSTPYESTVIGVVSSRPAIVLGSAPFRPDRLRAIWGDSVADKYEREREALRSQALRETAHLQRLAERLQSVRGGPEPQEADPQTGGDGPPSQAPVSLSEPPEPAAFHHRANRELDRLVEQRALELFFEAHFAAVALAGRVPVKADASYGSIVPGDFLTASPIPGIAMRASEPGPVIATALEGLPSGEGEILALVDRGWYGGEEMRATRDRRRSTGPERSSAGYLAHRLHEKDEEIDDLRKRVAALEEMLDSLIQGHPAAARPTPAAP